MLVTCNLHPLVPLSCELGPPADERCRASERLTPSTRQLHPTMLPGRRAVTDPRPGWLNPVSEREVVRSWQELDDVLGRKGG